MSTIPTNAPVTLISFASQPKLIPREPAAILTLAPSRAQPAPSGLRTAPELPRGGSLIPDSAQVPVSLNEILSVQRQLMLSPGQATLAQANSLPAGVLSLLR